MKILSPLILAALLVGCATPMPTAPLIQQQPSVAVPTPAPLVMQRVEWKVYNLAELKKLIERLEKEGKKDFVIFALTEDGYKALANNMIEIERFINEQKQVTILLRQVLDGRSRPNG